MTSRLLSVVLFFSVSCGPRSGVQHEDLSSENSDFCGTEKLTSFETPRLDNGQTLFKRNCGACHSYSVQTIVGPGLGNVLDRLPDPPENYFVRHVLMSDSAPIPNDNYSEKLRADYPEFVGHKRLIYEDKITEDAVNDILSYLQTGKQ